MLIKGVYWGVTQQTQVSKSLRAADLEYCEATNSRYLHFRCMNFMLCNQHSKKKNETIIQTKTSFLLIHTYSTR